MGRLATDGAELAAEVACLEVDAVRQRLHIKRPGVLAVDPVTNTA